MVDELPIAASTELGLRRRRWLLLLLVLVLILLVLFVLVLLILVLVLVLVVLGLGRGERAKVETRAKACSTGDALHGGGRDAKRLLGPLSVLLSLGSGGSGGHLSHGVLCLLARLPQ